ncbi:MAG TPA: DUF5666 domain-containing protein [Thermoanaerobaculia bacterium]
MKIIRATSFLTALCVAAILTGCGSTGVGDILGGGRDSGTTTRDRNNDPYDDQYESIGEIRGTVERVDTRDRVILMDSEGTNSRYLRNGNGNEVALYYDDRTTVRFQGQTYRPEDLERGDRIEVDAEQSGSRLIAQQIDVLYDATGGTTDRDSGSYDSGRYNDNDDLGTRNDQELRGVVRSLNTRDRTMEIEERSSFGSSTRRGDIVTVYYDAGTTVEFEGRNYKPENLERGDMVEVEIRRVGGRLMAQEILVVGGNSTTR